MNYFRQLANFKFYQKRLNFLLTLFLLILVLSITKRYWLVFLDPEFSSRFENSQLFSSVESIINILSTLSLFFLSIYKFIINPHNMISEINSIQSPLIKNSFSHIKDYFSIFNDSIWIDRNISNVKEFRKFGRICFVGKMKVGKTRESLELIKKSISECLFSSESILTISPSIKFMSQDILLDLLSQKFDCTIPVLLLIDNFPVSFEKEFLHQLKTLINFIEKRTNLFIICSGNVDQITNTHKKWLSTMHFKTIEVPIFTEQQTIQLLSELQKSLDITLDCNLKKEIAKISDGIPGNTILCMNRMKSQGITSLDRNNAIDFFKESIYESWFEISRYIESRFPISKYIFESLNILHLNNIPSNKSIFLFLIKYLAKRDGLHFSHKVINNCMKYLNFFQIYEKNDYIIYPDSIILLNDKIKAEELFLDFFKKNKEQLKFYCPEIFKEIILSSFNKSTSFKLSNDDLGFFGDIEKYNTPKRIKTDVRKRYDKRKRLILSISTIADFLFLILFFLLIIFIFFEKDQSSLFWTCVFVFALVGCMHTWIIEILLTNSILLGYSFYFIFSSKIENLYFVSYLNPVSLLILILFIFLTFGFLLSSIRRFELLNLRTRIQDYFLGLVIGALNGYLLYGILIYYIIQFHYIDITTFYYGIDGIKFLAIYPYFPPIWLVEPTIYIAMIISFIYILLIYI